MNPSVFLFLKKKNLRLSYLYSKGAEWENYALQAQSAEPMRCKGLQTVNHRGVAR